MENNSLSDERAPGRAKIFLEEVEKVRAKLVSMVENGDILSFSESIGEVHGPWCATWFSMFVERNCDGKCGVEYNFAPMPPIKHVVISLYQPGVSLNIETIKP